MHLLIFRKQNSFFSIFLARSYFSAIFFFVFLFFFDDFFFYFSRNIKTFSVFTIFFFPQNSSQVLPIFSEFFTNFLQVFCKFFSIFSSFFQVFFSFFRFFFFSSFFLQSVYFDLIFALIFELTKCPTTRDGASLSLLFLFFSFFSFFSFFRFFFF